MPRTKLLTAAHRTAVAALLVAAAAPATASADSLVFVKDHNVWLSAPDGSKLTAVTTDGTADSPYRSPSQADDGTIAASKDQLIVRLRQNGEVINAIDPPVLRTSASTPIDGVPVSVAISPDGSKIAYQYATYNCPIGVSCMGRTATGITWADRPTPASAFATTYFNHPRWVGNSRLVVGGGYLSHANLVDIAAGSQPSHWFDDQDYFDPSSDLSHTAVSRDGTRVAALHGYDGDSETNMRLVWFNATADPRTAALPPAKPEVLCATNVLRGYADPVWSPSGEGLAFTLPDGLYVARNLTRAGGDACAEVDVAMVHAGATDPDWGPADVNPQPRTTPQQAPSGSGTPGAPGTAGGGGQTPVSPGGTTDGPTTGHPIGTTVTGTVSIARKVSLKAALRNGVRVRVAELPPRTKFTVRLRLDAKTAKRAGLGKKPKVIGKRSVTTDPAGKAEVTVTLSRTAAKRLRRLSNVTITVSAGDHGPATKVTLR